MHCTCTPIHASSHLPLVIDLGNPHSFYPWQVSQLDIEVCQCQDITGNLSSQCKKTRKGNTNVPTPTYSAKLCCGNGWPAFAARYHSFYCACFYRHCCQKKTISQGSVSKKDVHTKWIPAGTTGYCCQSRSLPVKTLSPLLAFLLSPPLCQFLSFHVLASPSLFGPY